jgi:2-phosphoglycolate phosphatase
MIAAVLFDLDGTFADTAPDLGNALNRQLTERGLAPLPIEKVRRVASSGARGLLKLGFDLSPGDADYDRMRVEFLDYYEQDLLRDTTLFPGIEALISALENSACPWGIVTNKAQRFTLPLLRLMGLDRRAGCIVCGDTTPHIKPHPAPMYAAATAIGVDAGACLYLGDDERDMLAGRAAGMRVAVASYGYLGTGKPPAEWPADYWIDHPLDLLPIVIGGKA